MEKKNLLTSLFILVLFTFSLSLCSQNAAGINSSPAAQFVIDQVKKQSRIVAVYIDFGDAMNRYTQRAALRQNSINMPVLDEKAPSEFGVSCIKVTYPLEGDDWNGFIFVTGILEKGSITPYT